VVIPHPLRDCVARPDVDGQRFGLIEHLIAVAERCGRADGPPEERLAFLAGLLHDAAKAAFGWQEYIQGRRKQGPNHAPLGAALFAYWAEELVPLWVAERPARQRLFDLAADWTRIVYDHHGEVRDLTPAQVPWLQSNPGDDFLDLLAESDRDGLMALVRLFFPEAATTLDGFSGWLNDFGDRWHRRLKFDRDALVRDRKRSAPPTSLAPLAEQGLRLAELGSRLIFADRSHAADWDAAYLSRRDAEGGVLQLGSYCGRRAEEALLAGASGELVRRRGRMGVEALETYRQHRDAGLFSLVLPTGCGKTVAGLRIALEACRTDRCRRIIYVAPYLSILSQAAAEIRSACGLEVFVHHHLSAALLEDHQPYDVLETWQAPVLATTFNQLCRALFPKRAQQCLRIPALDGAFILVDEPQIIDPQVWNLFLKALEVAARRRHCQILFLTATLPPTAYGLDEQPVELVSREAAFALSQVRYAILSTEERWDAGRLAEEASRRLASGGSVAAILNTVRDAVDVFAESRKTAGCWFCLTARMLPGHKGRIIRAVRELLEPGRPGGPEAVGVVSSQVIEAGVDLSFRNLLRARPIYSSVVQAAGRANRHGEGQPAEVVVFPFVRLDGKDSRMWVYRDETACQQTDQVLRARPRLTESEVPGALESYYREWWSRCKYGASLAMLEKAARGEWSAVAGLTPFSDDMPREEVFVPGSEGYLSEEGRKLLGHFRLKDSRELLRSVQDPAFRRSLTFLDRKRLSALVRQFTVAVPARTVGAIASRTALEWLWVLDDPARYSADTGLALGTEEDSDDETVII
jgi:CRISPR-associated helicase Cas3/CRISPR-associated endonuclease Cas3-HD